jgi:hypothetical protein
MMCSDCSSVFTPKITVFGQICVSKFYWQLSIYIKAKKPMYYNVFQNQCLLAKARNTYM